MNTSPTALFDSYHNDFQQFIVTIQDKLEGDPTNDRAGVLRRVDMDLDEADEMVSQMELELQGIPQSKRPVYQSKLRDAKNELSRFKKLAKEARSQAARLDLLSSSQDHPSLSDDPYASTSDRTGLLAGTALLEDGSRRLQDSYRIALETENQGADILMNLRSQREQIEHTRNTLQTADVSIDRASGTLKKMIRRMYQQRFVTAAIIFVLVLLIVVIIWEKLS
ncbi:vesicle transport v-snare protein vti1 [Amanita rubescens]|nr:vesicle transport v-snare protein vti1 [Amanita rubescens]